MKPRDFEERFVRQRKNVESLRYTHKQQTEKINDLCEQLTLLERKLERVIANNNIHDDICEEPSVDIEYNEWIDSGKEADTFMVVWVTPKNYASLN